MIQRHQKFAANKHRVESLESGTGDLAKMLIISISQTFLQLDVLLARRGSHRKPPDSESRWGQSWVLIHSEFLDCRTIQKGLSKRVLNFVTSRGNFHTCCLTVFIQIFLESEFR